MPEFSMEDYLGLTCDSQRKNVMLSAHCQIIQTMPELKVSDSRKKYINNRVDGHVRTNKSIGLNSLAII